MYKKNNGLSILLLWIFSLFSINLTQAQNLNDDLTENFTIGMYQNLHGQFGRDHPLIMGWSSAQRFNNTWVQDSSVRSGYSYKSANSVFPLLVQDGFNTALIYHPDYGSNANIIQGTKGYLAHAKNCGIKLILDYKTAFTPDQNENYSPDTVHLGTVKGEYIMSYTNNSNRVNLKALYDQVFTDTTYGSALAGIQFAEEPSAGHVYTPDPLGHPWCGQRILTPPDPNCVSVSIPPYAISDAIDTMNSYFATGQSYFPTIVSEAYHGGVIDSNTVIEQPHSPYYPQHYAMTDSMNTLPSTYMNSSYYVFDSNSHDETRHNYDSLLYKKGPRSHYLGRFKTLDFLRPRIDNIISGFQLRTWEDFTDISFKLGISGNSQQVVDNLRSHLGTGPDHTSLLTTIHSDTTKNASVNKRNGNALWFKVYTSIIHGTDGVIFWEFNCWEPTVEDSINHDSFANKDIVLPYPGLYDRNKLPRLYKDFMAPLARELRWLSDNKFIGKAAKTIYKKTDHQDNHCVIGSPDGPGGYMGSEVQTARKNENYGIRYTINTNGDDVVMILSNPLYNKVKVPLDFSEISNDIIQNADSIEFMFHEDTDPDYSFYKTFRDGGVDLGTGEVMRSHKVPFQNDTISVTFGPLDVVILRFSRDDNKLNTQINHWEKIWANQGDGVIGGSKLQANDTLFIGDFMGLGYDQLIVMQTDSGHAWTSMHSYNSLDEKWNWLWSNNGDTSNPLLDYKKNFAVGKFENSSKDLLLGFDPVSGKKELFEFNNSTLSWTQRWVSDPLDQIVQYKKILSVGDYDGDGTEELIAYDNPGWTTEFKFDGTDFVWGSWSDLGVGDIKNYRNAYARSADYNGNGKDELIGFGSDMKLFEYDVINSQWDSIWSDTVVSSGGWGSPLTLKDAVLSGDIDNADPKDELFFVQVGPSAGWALSYDLNYDVPTTTYSWSWNYSANPFSSIDYIRDWPIKEFNGTNSEYYLIQTQVNQPKRLLTKRRFGCNSGDLRHMLALYKTQPAYNYKAIGEQDEEKTNEEEQIAVEAIDRGLAIYPNPFSKIVNIEVLNDETIKNILVYNSVGKLLKVTSEGINGSQAKLDFSSNLGVVEGHYVLQVITNKTVYSETVLLKR